ncbi:hypothetical protein V2W45_1345156 [Cenococcum geophilum]
MPPTGTPLTILALLTPRTFAFQHNITVGLEGLTFNPHNHRLRRRHAPLPLLPRPAQRRARSLLPLYASRRRLQLALRARNQRHRARSHDVRSPRHEHRPAVVLLLLGHALPGGGGGRG